MRVELPSYSEYVETGIPWLGELPSHWGYRQLGFISNRVSVGLVINPSTYVTDEGVPFLLGGDVRDFQIDITECNRCPAEVSDGVLRKSRLSSDDLVVVRVGYPGVAAVVPPELEGSNCASMMIVRKHGRYSSRWLAYVFNSQIGRDQVGIVQYGAAQKQFNIGHAVKFRFPFPPLDEQRAITAFLNRETAKIDRLMAVRRKQVECLQEQRTAVIHHAVTKGLDPQAKMKPSGDDWLGNVPEGWTVKRLKFWVKHISTQVSVMPDGHAYIALEHVEGKTGRILPNESADFDSSVKLFKANDVLFGRLRPYLAKVALPDFDGVGVGEFMVLRADQQELSPRYLQLRLLTPNFIDLVDGSTQGAKMPRANWSFVGDIKVAFPLRADQDAVVAHIDRETTKLDTLITKFRRELELLTEYRASLISHAVTGKIDVRGLVEPTP